MPRPLIGIGHSAGGCQIVNLSLMHPRLFSSLVLLDPIIQLSAYDRVLGTSPPGMLNMVAYRRDVWSSREAAIKAYAKNPMLASWDPRVFRLMMQYGLRDLPTELYPATDGIFAIGTDSATGSLSPPETPVTLTSTKYQEVWTLIRPNYNNRDPITGQITIDRSTRADCDPLMSSIPLYRPEARATFPKLPALRPSVLFLLGSKTEVNLDELREGVKVTGTGVGGSGGISEGMVKEFTLQEKGHLFCFEAVDETAGHCAVWLGEESRRWRAESEKWRQERAGRQRKDDLIMDEKFRKVVKAPVMPGRKQPETEASKL
ncbi:hypothetical protein MMC17_003832 [Xylographa soralifera]|nr:hypothetical protein [Xylographa soralifera]